MFKYTKAAILLIVDRLKLIGNIVKYGSIAVSIAYYIVAIILEMGNLIINSVLLGVLAIYLIFEISTLKINAKKLKKITKRILNWTKFITKGVSLGITIYSIYTASTNANGLSIILATLMIIMWVISVLLEVIVEVVQDKVELVISAVKKDTEFLQKSYYSISNTFKKIKGEEEVEFHAPNEKHISLLDKRILKKKKNEEKDK